MGLPILLAKAGLTTLIAGGSAATALQAVLLPIVQNIYIDNRDAFKQAYANAQGINVNDITPAQEEKLVDAIRHTYISAKLSNLVGETGAQIFNLWEWNPVNVVGLAFEPTTLGNTNMDFWNNDVGRTIGSSAIDDADIIQKIINAVDNGELILDLNDPRTYDDSLLLDFATIMQSGEISLENLFAEEQFVAANIQLPSLQVEALPSHYGNTLVFFNVEFSAAWDPLVIDLDGDGVVADFLDTTSNSAGILQTIPVYFDWDSNGFAEATTWHSDGFLVRDVNANGLIDNGSEMFGNNVIDGFTALAAFDSDNNGVIDANDAVWSELQIWHDINADGLTQNGELLTLASQDIVEIGLTSETASVFNQPELLLTGAATTSTGQQVEIGDYNFAQGSANTRYALDYDFDVRAAFLPTVRGYNEIPEFHVALSLDNDETDPNSLMALMTDIASNSFTDFFVNYDDIVSKLEQVAFRWAGVDAIDPASRGEFIRDARILEFFEEYFGQGFVDRQFNTNPGLVQAELAHELWDDQVFRRFKANILTQMSPKEIYEVAPEFDFVDDTLNNVTQTTVSQSALNELETAALALTDTEARTDFWLGVADYLRTVRGATSDRFDITASNEAILNAAVSNSDASLVWTYEDHDPDNGVTSIEYRFFNAVGSTFEGDATDNTINGTINSDLIIGFEGADTLNGGDGNDTIYGFAEDETNDDAANDFIEGGNDDDIMFGGAGDDTLVGGQGADQLFGGNGNDLLFDGNGLNTDRDQNFLDGGAGNDTYFISGTNNQVSRAQDVFIQDESGEDYLRFSGTPNFPNSEFVHFDLGTVRRVGNDTIQIFGSQGQVGYDVTLIDQLTDLNNQSGVGIEWIRVKNGSQSSEWQNLKDILLNWSGGMQTQGSENDDIITGIEYGNFEDSIASGAGNDIVFGGKGNDVIGSISGENTFYGDEGDDRLEGGSDNDTLFGGEGNDILFGRDGNNTLNGDSGSDQLIGGNFDDILNGGDGDDTLTGSLGNDTYILSSGNDLISDSGRDNIVVAPGDIMPEELDFTFNDFSLLISGNLDIFTGTTELSGQRNSNPGAVGFIKFSDGFEMFLPRQRSWEFGTDNSAGSDETITSNDSVFFTGDGTDRIYAGFAVSYISAGAGDDFLFGDGRDDWLHGGTGNDYLDGGIDNDMLFGGTGNDVYAFASSSGLDTITEAGGFDTIEFDGSISIENLTFVREGIENAKIISVAGVDEITVNKQRNSGNNFKIETLLFSNDFSVSFDRYDTDQWIELTASGLPYNGSENDETIIGSAANDVINGLAGDDEIASGAGDDIISGGLSNDTIDGGSGDDEAVFERSFSNYTITDHSGYFIVQDNSGLEGTDTLYNIESIRFSDGIWENGIFTEIIPPNEAPVITNNGVTLDEGTSVTLTAAMLGATDPDNLPPELTFTLVTIPVNSELTREGVVLAVNSTFTMQDLIDGLIAFMPGTDENGSFGFSFTVSDGINTVGPEFFFINVTPVDDPIDLDNIYTIFEHQIGGQTFTVEIDNDVPLYSIDDVLTQTQNINDFIKDAATANGATLNASGNINENALEYFGGSQNPSISLIGTDSDQIKIGGSGVGGSYKFEFLDTETANLFGDFAKDLLGKDPAGTKIYDISTGTNGGSNRFQGFRNDEIVNLNNGEQTEQSYVFKVSGESVSGTAVYNNFDDYIEAAADLFDGQQILDGLISNPNDNLDHLLIELTDGADLDGVNDTIEISAVSTPTIVESYQFSSEQGALNFANFVDQIA